jgi:hypothetical protein
MLWRRASGRSRSSGERGFGDLSIGDRRPGVGVFDLAGVAHRQAASSMASIAAVMARFRASEKENSIASPTQAPIPFLVPSAESPRTKITPLAPRARAVIDAVRATGHRGDDQSQLCRDAGRVSLATLITCLVENAMTDQSRLVGRATVFFAQLLGFGIVWSTASSSWTGGFSSSQATRPSMPTR